MKLILSSLVCSLFLIGTAAAVPPPTANASDYSDVAQPDWRGLRNDTYSFMGYQLLVVGILYYGPDSLSGWTDEQRDNFSASRYPDNIRKLVWDTDKIYVNYILHPYWGGTYIVRGRERGLSATGAFWYSAMLSTLFEYGPEAFFEEPSIQDLIVTPVVGSAVGLYFMNVREPLLKRRQAGDSLSSWDKTRLILTDPLGSMNTWVMSWMKPGVQAQWLPYSVNSGSGNGRFGLSLVLRW